MLWWTGCSGCGPTCGGPRRRSEPERAGGERAGALGLACFDGGGSLERRRSRQLALRLVPWPLGCRATGRALSASCAWWRFLRLRQHTGARYGRDPGNGGNRSPETSPQTKTQEKPVETRCRRCRFLCANNSGSANAVPLPGVAGRSRQTAALTAAAFAAASPSLSIWGGVGAPVPQLAAVCAGARGEPAPGVSTFSQAAAARTSCFSVILTPNSFRSSGVSSISLRNRVTRSRQEGRWAFLRHLGSVS